MNRRVIVGAFAILGGTFAIGVGCGGSTSDTLTGSTGAGGSATAGSAGTSATGGTVGTGGAQTGGSGGSNGGAVGTGGKGTAGSSGSAGKGAGGATAGTGGTGAGGTGAGGTGVGGKGTAGTGGVAAGGNGAGGVAAGGNGTGGVSTTGAGGGITIFDASVDVDPDTSIGNDATVGTCYECVGAKCQMQLDSCAKDPKCEAATSCVLSTCQGTMDFMCVLGCGQAAGITSPMDPAAQELIGVAQCTQQSCSAACGAGQMTMGMGPGGMGPGGGGTTGAGGFGTGGNGTGGNGQMCSFQKCGQSCPSAVKCFQDKTCQACLKNPMTAGCDTNATYQALTMCCTANADVCGGCMFCP